MSSEGIGHLVWLEMLREGYELFTLETEV